MALIFFHIKKKTFATTLQSIMTHLVGMQLRQTTIQESQVGQLQPAVKKYPLNSS